MQAVHLHIVLRTEAKQVAELFSRIDGAASDITASMRADHLAARDRVTTDAEKHLPKPPDLRLLMAVVLVASGMFLPSVASVLAAARWGSNAGKLVGAAESLAVNGDGLLRAPRGLDLQTMEWLLQSLPLLEALDRIDVASGGLAATASGFPDDLSEALGRFDEPLGAPFGGYNQLRAIQDFVPQFRAQTTHILASGRTLLGRLERAAGGFDAAEEYRRVLSFGAEGFLLDLDRQVHDDRIVRSVAERYIRYVLEPEFESSIRMDALQTPRLRSTPNSLYRLSSYTHWRNPIERSIGTPQYDIGGCLVPLTLGGVGDADHQQFLKTARDLICETENGEPRAEVRGATDHDPARRAGGSAWPRPGELRTRPLEELRKPTGHDLVLEVTSILRAKHPAAMAFYRRIALDGSAARGR